MTSICYFDYAAATPLDERVFGVMKPYLSERFFNPSSPYAPAVAVRRDYQAAKQAIGRIIGAQAGELIMTAGATESINLAIGSFRGHRICSRIEHDSVRRAVEAGPHTIVPVQPNGRVDITALKAAITPQTELISVALANHELGTIQPVRQVAELVQATRQARAQQGNSTPLVLHCDGSQGLGLLDIHVARLGVDLLSLNAAKVYGPKQVGLLWVRPGLVLQPHTYGGGQEQGLRSGTENVAGVIGFAEAMRLADKKRNPESTRLAQLRDGMQRQLVEALPGLVCAGSHKHRLANFLHIAVPGVDAERLVFMLETKGVLVATGSACAANKGTGSAVLEGIGMPIEHANGSLRLTLGRPTTQAACDQAVAAIIDAVRTERARQEQA